MTKDMKCPAVHWETLESKTPRHSNRLALVMMRNNVASQVCFDRVPPRTSNGAPSRSVESINVSPTLEVLNSV